MLEDGTAGSFCAVARPSKLLPINYWGKWRTLSEIKETIIMVVKSYNLVEKVFLFSCSIYLIGSNWEFLALNCMKLIKDHIQNYIQTNKYNVISKYYITYILHYCYIKLHVII